MTTESAVLLTVREALERLKWVTPDSPRSLVTSRSRRLLQLCKARGITVERFSAGGHRYISAPELDAYIASLQAERSDG